MLIALQCYYLRVKTLNQIITMVETWFDHPCLNYKPITNLNDCMKIEYALVENVYDLIEKVEFFVGCGMLWFV